MTRNLFALLIFAACTGGAAANDQSTIKMVYPSGKCVPSNILRMHLEFPHAMERGQVRRAVSLHRESGEPIDGAILGIELWNREQTVLTLLFEPGRIKRGVGPNMRVGPALIANQRYHLRVGPPLKRARSGATIAEAVHRFCTVEPLREAVSTYGWSSNNVRPGTREPLLIQFDRMMDAASVSGRLNVERGAVPVTGELNISPNGMLATFVPGKPWIAGKHSVVAHPTLEDVAGNRLGLRFDAETGARNKVSLAGRYTFQSATRQTEN